MRAQERYAIGMRVVGRIRLAALAEGAAPELRSAVSSLYAELHNTAWSSADDMAADYPAAQRFGHRFYISLCDQYCAVVVVNFETGIVVVESAGLNAARSSIVRQKRSKSA